MTTEARLDGHLQPTSWAWLGGSVGTVAIPTTSLGNQPSGNAVRAAAAAWFGSSTSMRGGLEWRAHAVLGGDNVSGHELAVTGAVPIADGWSILGLAGRGIAGGVGSCGGRVLLGVKFRERAASSVVPEPPGLD